MKSAYDVTGRRSRVESYGFVERQSRDHYGWRSRHRALLFAEDGASMVIRGRRSELLDEPDLFDCEVATEYCIIHQHVRPAFKLLLGIALTLQEHPELVGDRRPVQLKYGIVRDPHNPPG